MNETEKEFIKNLDVFQKEVNHWITNYKNEVVSTEKAMSEIISANNDYQEKEDNILSKVEFDS